MPAREDSSHDRLSEMLQGADRFFGHVLNEKRADPPGLNQPAPKQRSAVCQRCGQAFVDSYRTRKHQYCTACNKVRFQKPAPAPADLDPTKEKRCSVCGKVKPLDEFYRRGRKEPGHHAWCIDCLKSSSRLTARFDYKYGREVTVTEKACSKCGETKPATEFSRSGRSRNGLQSQCKACHAGYRYK